MLTIAHNLRRVARDRETITIGGGDFTPDELLQAAKMIEASEKMLSVLARIVGQDEPNQYCYDAAVVAMDDQWRAEARNVYLEAKEIQDGK